MIKKAQAGKAKKAGNVTASTYISRALKTKLSRIAARRRWKLANVIARACHVYAARVDRGAA